jgi:TolA-binding protein
MQARAAFLVAATLLLPTLALAQAAPADGQPPAREGNVWGSVSHQPTEGEVREQEKAAGLLGAKEQQRQRADEVNELDRQILQRAQQGMNDGVLNGSAATKPLPPQ